MKRILFICSILTVLFVAACNTDTKKEETPPTTEGTKDTHEEQNNEGNVEDTSKEDEEEVTQEEVISNEPNETENTENEPSNDNSITYQSNNQEVKATIVHTKSPQQDYHINLMDGFTLTAEEPGRDVVMADINPDVSMRIETFSKEDTVFEDLLANTTDSVEVIASDEGASEYDLGSVQLEEDITNLHTFDVKYEDDSVITILYEKPNKYIRLTIFDTNEHDLKDALVQMGVSIQ